MKIVVNRCFGGFGLSYKAVMRYGELIGKKIYAYVNKDMNSFESNTCKQVFEDSDLFTIYLTKPNLKKFPKGEESVYFSYRDISRDDKNLIKVIEELGEEANDCFADLEIVEIPDGTDWTISEYDGMETVEEKHRS